jgi:hypothetical protein
VTETATGATRESRQLSSEDNQREFLPPGNPWCVGLLPLENPELLTQEQDFELLVMLSLMPQSDEVEEQGERLGKKNKDHADLWCRDHAEGKNVSVNGAGAEL